LIVSNFSSLAVGVGVVELKSIPCN
jgi:hypothetical protein